MAVTKKKGRVLKKSYSLAFENEAIFCTGNTQGHRFLQIFFLLNAFWEGSVIPSALLRGEGAIGFVVRRM